MIVANLGSGRMTWVSSPVWPVGNRDSCMVKIGQDTEGSSRRRRVRTGA